MNSGIDGRRKDQSVFSRRQSPNHIPHRLQPCDSLPSVETTVFFDPSKLRAAIGHTRRISYAVQRTVGYMVGAPACGWVKTGRTPSAGNTEKATNPRKNERGENSIRGSIGIRWHTFTQAGYSTRMGWPELKSGQVDGLTRALMSIRAKSAPPFQEGRSPSVCLPDWTKA